MILSLSVHLIIWMETCISQVCHVIMIRLIEKDTFLYWTYICGLVSLRPHPIAYPFCCAALLYSVFRFFNVSIHVADKKERPHCIQSRARLSLVRRFTIQVTIWRSFKWTVRMKNFLWVSAFGQGCFSMLELVGKMQRHGNSLSGEFLFFFFFLHLF